MVYPNLSEGGIDLGEGAENSFLQKRREEEFTPEIKYSIYF